MTKKEFCHTVARCAYDALPKTQSSVISAGFATATGYPGCTERPDCEGEFFMLIYWIDNDHRHVVCDKPYWMETRTGEEVKDFAGVMARKIMDKMNSQEPS